MGGGLPDAVTLVALIGTCGVMIRGVDSERLHYLDCVL